MTMREVPASLAEKLEAAAHAFAASFEDVRMDDVAAASGIPRATLYYYFSGKDDVLAFLLRTMLADLTVSVAEAAATDGDTDARLAAVVRSQLAHLAANPATGQLLLANLGKAGKLPDIAAGIDGGFHEPVRQILRDGQRSGEIVDLDVEITASALFGAVTAVGFRGLLLDGGIDVDRIAGSLFPLFWAGLVRPKQRPLRATR
jgi:TetR/AcrR family transcriptional regulator